jgi:hypothetical protein
MRRDKYEIIQPNNNVRIRICPINVPNYVYQNKGDAKWYIDIDNKPVVHILKDGILSKIIKQRGNLYKVINHNETKETYLITDGIEWSHGETLKQAKESLMYKVTNRDTSSYNDLTIDSVVSITFAIRMYRSITGACESQTRSFVENLKDRKDEYSIKEIIAITDGQYNSQKLKQFFTKI